MDARLVRRGRQRAARPTGAAPRRHSPSLAPESADGSRLRRSTSASSRCSPPGGSKWRRRPSRTEFPSPRPFAEDTEHSSYDREAVERFWQALRRIDWTLQEFAGWFCDKTSPVHLLWHGLDLAILASRARAPLRTRTPTRSHARPIRTRSSASDSADPRETLLELLESAYEAGAVTAGWDLDGLRSSWCPTPAAREDLSRGGA
jgi:Family of unknown function (DUF5996)